MHRDRNLSLFDFPPGKNSVKRLPPAPKIVGFHHFPELTAIARSIPARVLSANCDPIPNGASPRSRKRPTG